MKVAKFTNELGAKMTIKVKNVTGERPKPGNEAVTKYKGVSLSIQDVETTTEWTITRDEAKQLSATLSAFLSAAPEKITAVEIVEIVKHVEPVKAQTARKPSTSQKITPFVI